MLFTNPFSSCIMVQGAWRKTGRAEREAERKDEEVYGAIPGGL